MTMPQTAKTPSRSRNYGCVRGRFSIGLLYPSPHHEETDSRIVIPGFRIAHPASRRACPSGKTAGKPPAHSTGGVSVSLRLQDAIDVWVGGRQPGGHGCLLHVLPLLHPFS